MDIAKPLRGLRGPGRHLLSVVSAAIQEFRLLQPFAHGLGRRQFMAGRRLKGIFRRRVIVDIRAIPKQMRMYGLGNAVELAIVGGDLQRERKEIRLVLGAQDIVHLKQMTASGKLRYPIVIEIEDIKTRISASE